MSVQQFLYEMQKIQGILLEFLNEKEFAEENSQNLNTLFDDLKICDDQYKLKSLLHLLTKIANNHYRCSNFFSNIFQILLLFKKGIKKHFSNWDIFNIFKSNKRILLFLVEEELMIMDDRVAKEIVTSYKCKKSKYPQYFAPEIKPYINENWFQEDKELIEEINKEIPENFYELRKIGENETTICTLIQKDMIKDFVVHINRNNLPLDMKIELSIYETNCLLVKKSNISLIEYAAFFGSIQIFKYLKIEGVELTSFLWPFAIHGKNAEIIHLLEDNDKPSSYQCKQFLMKSIKYHHNDVAKFFLDNYLQNKEDDSQVALFKSLKYYNFAFIQNSLLNESSFVILCRDDYYPIADILLKHKNIDMNMKLFILKLLFLNRID